MQIVGKSVVIDHALKFELVRRNDRVIAVIEQYRSMHCFVSPLVVSTFFHQGGSRDMESDSPIDTSAFPAMFRASLLGIAVENRDFISQEFRRAASRMRDQGFLG